VLLSMGLELYGGRVSLLHVGPGNLFVRLYLGRGKGTKIT